MGDLSFNFCLGYSIGPLFLHPLDFKFLDFFSCFSCLFLLFERLDLKEVDDVVSFELKMSYFQVLDLFFFENLSNFALNVID
jgi:hypothetical protein